MNQYARDTVPFRVWPGAADEKLFRPVLMVALVPAHNEADGIGATIQSLLDQSRPLDRIVVICDNCTDDTRKIAANYPVIVIATQGNTYRKSGALNLGWSAYGQDADIIVCADGDTRLPTHAVADWEQEFTASRTLGGSSCQVVMTGTGFLPRMQRAEFAKSNAISLRRGWTSVISGTGCAYRNAALREVARRPEQQAGPWTYESVVEDFFLTYQLRRMGWETIVSGTVFCWTGSMPTIKALWYQRIKWQTGTVHDLVRFGVSKLTFRDWLGQIFALMCIIFWVLWLALNSAELATGNLRFDWFWLAFPLYFSLIEMRHIFFVRDKSWKDFLFAGTLAFAYSYTCLCMGWVVVSWWKFITASKEDLWSGQYRAEGIEPEAAEAEAEEAFV